MSSCVSSQPTSDRVAPQDDLGSGGGSREGQKPCEALRGLSSLSIHLGMESFIVVTECEPGRGVDLSLARDQPLEADGQDLPLNASESESRSLLSGRKMSLQERSQGGPASSSSLDMNGRCICPSLPYSPASSPQSSPRMPRRPTVESHHVSITGLQVRGLSELWWGRWEGRVSWWTVRGCALRGILKSNKANIPSRAYWTNISFPSFSAPGKTFHSRQASPMADSVLHAPFPRATELVTDAL